VTTLGIAECDIPCRAMSQSPMRNFVTDKEGPALQKKLPAKKWKEQHFYRS